MRILLDSHAYAPGTGGIETVSQLLAEGLQQRGHQVVITTRTPAAAEPHEPSVIRSPGVLRMCRLLWQSDVLLQSNISLMPFLLAVLWRVPIVLIHHTWINRVDGRMAARDRWKLRATRLAGRNLVVSDALGKRLPVPTTLFPNPYRSAVFDRLSGISRDQDLVFLGRLVSDKGVDLLLEALASVPAPKRFGLTLIGDGPERGPLEQQAQKLGITGQVRFLGNLPPEQVALELNRHRVLVVPSRWNEPYGLIALEGLACGCRVVGSQGGGLPEAMGGLGWTFPNGDGAALARVIVEAMATDREQDPDYLSALQSHLEPHRPEQVAAFCDAVLREVVP